MASMPLPELLTLMDRATAAQARERAAEAEVARLAQLRQALADEGQVVSNTALQAALLPDSPVSVASPPGPKKQAPSETSWRMALFWCAMILVVPCTSVAALWVGNQVAETLTTPLQSAPVVPSPLIPLRPADQATLDTLNHMQGDLNMGRLKQLQAAVDQERRPRHGRPLSPGHAEQQLLATQTLMSLAQGMEEAQQLAKGRPDASH
jgi:hypothetical protein